MQQFTVILKVTINTIEDVTVTDVKASIEDELAEFPGGTVEVASIEPVK
jgi:hypothetical protein